MNIRRIKKQASKQAKTKEEIEKKTQCRLSLSHKDATK